MIELLSIHIPKTGGTSFYHIMKQIYGDHLSISYKRKDYKEAKRASRDFYQSIPDKIEVVHGHLRYEELKSIHYATNAHLICWLRDPVDRVVSNYLFFKKGLNDPTKNPVNYQVNKHRINESLLEYARRLENQNRMSEFVEGVDIMDFYFVGLMERFDRDLSELARLLKWPSYNIPKLNVNVDKKSNSEWMQSEWIEEIAHLNHKDVALFQRALKRRDLIGNAIKG